jgi:hypothetical protein
MEVSGQIHTPDALSRYALGRWLGEAQSRFGCCREKTNLLPLLGIELLSFSSAARGLVATATEIVQLEDM